MPCSGSADNCTLNEATAMLGSPAPARHGCPPPDLGPRLPLLRYHIPNFQPDSRRPFPLGRRDFGSVSADMGLGGRLSNINSLYTLDQKLSIQGISIAAGALSIAACLVSLYWFLLLQRNFRRTLVMMLLFADFWKSLWYTMFSAVSISVGGIKTGSIFCSVGGYFLQTGLGASDFAILAMSLHMTVQIFHADSRWFGPDGLYRARYAIYVVWIVIPCFMAALAFINHNGAYLSQGAFCSLPIRPFWYRLALSWIPRYLIWMFAIITAVRVYRHVGAGFKLFVNNACDSSERASGVSGNRQSRIPCSTNKSLLVAEKDDEVYNDMMATAAATASNMLFVSTDDRPQQHSRRASLVHFDLRDGSGHDDKATSRPPSQKGPGHENDTGPELLSTWQHPPCDESARAMHDVSLDVSSVAAIPPSTSTRPSQYSVMDQSASQRRRAIKRQVRLLFIYPVVYGTMLVIPFISHCMNYSDYYAQHPIFALTLLSTLCWASMGFVDCLCFSLREQPWRHIHGSDGSFWGSFKFWEIFGSKAGAGPPLRLAQGPSTQADSGGSYVGSDARRTPGSRASARLMLSNLRQKQAPVRRDFGGRSDRAAQAAEDAATRLQLERQERARSMQSKPTPNPTSPVKEWFERPISGISHQSGESKLSRVQSKTSSQIVGGGRLSVAEEDSGAK